ncbi:MAG: hypothetical protein CMM74_16005 [Rhodospirillaceae bacterium]|jgi:SAM-dependent methyltransferase|nr:hypothetical protein [Rhodospirillaceae bacterium]
MDDKFTTERTDYYFGCKNTSLSRALKQFPLDTKILPSRPSVDFKSWFHQLYQSSLIPLNIRQKLWRLFRRTGADETWFIPFQHYWSEVLEQRPMWGVADLLFLRGYYRLDFQKLALPDNGTVDDHVEGFQQSETIYSLLHQVYKESLINHAGLIMRVKAHLGHSPDSMIEYGSGSAPVTTSFFEFTPPRKRSIPIYLMDIETFTFQYAAYKFREFLNIGIVPLKPEDNLQMTGERRVDVIYCLTVMEHLNAPLETARKFHQSLLPGGLLVFDYIKGDGDGLDTAVGVEQRADVLDFIEKNFDVLSGSINRSSSMGTTIVRKK